MHQRSGLKKNGYREAKLVRSNSPNTNRLSEMCNKKISQAGYFLGFSLSFIILQCLLLQEQSKLIQTIGK